MGTLSRVQGNGATPAAGSAPSNTVTITLPSITAGNGLLVSVGAVDAAGTITASAADNASQGTWTQAWKRNNATATYSVWAFVLGGAAGAGSTVTVTVTFSAATTFRGITVSEWHDSAGSTSAWYSSGNQPASPTATGSGTAMAVASFTPAMANALVWAAWANGGAGNITAGTGMTGDELNSGSSLASVYQLQTTATATTAPGACSGSGQWEGGAVVLAPASATDATVADTPRVAQAVTAPASASTGASLADTPRLAQGVSLPATVSTSSPADVTVADAPAVAQAVTAPASVFAGSPNVTVADTPSSVQAVSQPAEASASTPAPVNPYWPKTSFQVAFNADPNDPDTEPDWTDLTTRLREWDGSFGRQYETDVNEAGEAEATLDDKDEWLNPANPDSPYAGGLFPMRQYLYQAMWPPQPVGPAVNMLNRWSGFDPTLESYPDGARPAWIADTAGGATPAVESGTAWQGSKALSWAVASGVERDVALLAYTIPGDVYTFSVYFRQSAAGSAHLYVNGGSDGGSTATVGSWVRLTLTFTAWESVHELWVVVNPAADGTVYVDALQVEPGEAVSAFDDSDDGPVVYGVSKGMVERWPTNWDYHGLRGMCQIECVDALAAFARIRMAAEYPAALASAAPTLWWRLHDQPGTTAFAETSGNPGVTMTAQPSQHGAGDVAAGSGIAYPGDPGGLGVALSGTSIDSPYAKGTGLQAGIAGGPARGFFLGGGTGPGDAWGLTVAVVFEAAAPADLTADYNMVTLTGPNGYFDPGGNAFLRLYAGPAAGGYGFHALAGYWTGLTPGWNGTATWEDDDTDSQAYFDGTARLGFVSLAWDGSDLTVSLRMDRAHTAVSHSVSGSDIDGLDVFMEAVQVGGIYDPSTDGVDQDNLTGYDTTYTEVAMWPAALDLAGEEVEALYAAFDGYAGELPGTRIRRWLAAYYHQYAAYASIDDGTSPMGPGNVSDQTMLLDACQYVTTSEGGDFWVDQWGVVQFEARTARWGRTAATWILGEDQDGGEYPYEDGIEFDFDDTHVYNLIGMTQTGGITYSTADAASQRRYFPSELDVEVGLEDPQKVVDTGRWLLATHKDAYQRVEGMQVSPGTNPALWRFALGARKGDRVKVRRRTRPGPVVDLDFFVERVEHSNAPGSWLTFLEASPAAGQIPWVLGDAVYSQLGVTTMLAY